MNAENKKINHKKLNLILLVLVIIFAIVAITETFVIVSLKTSGDSNSQNILVNTVETPVTDLVFNLAFVDNLRAEVSKEAPYSVLLKADVGDCKDIELLTVYFDDSSKGTAVGTFKDKNGNLVNLSVEMHNLFSFTSLTEYEIENLVSLQIDIIDSIVSNIEFVSYAEDTETTEAADQYISIETPYTEFKYPKKWEEYLKVEVNGDTPCEVVFICELPDRDPLMLFEVVFDGESQIPVGDLNGVSVGINVGTDEAEDSWTEEEKEIFYTMREDMGFAVDGLTEIDGFVLN